MDEVERRIHRSCTRFLSGHQPAPPHETLRALAERPESGEADQYGVGGPVAILEQRVARLLEKPAAIFFAKGMAAQLAVLKLRETEAMNPRVVIHPLSHMDCDEGGMLERVGGLQPIRLGQQRHFSRAQLHSLAERPAAVVLELPLRRAGYLLPDWDELLALAQWCRETGVPLHLDGARLWEAATHYGRAPAEIAALADSVYVSFYKGLGGIGGAAVAASAETVTALGPWRNRLGANLYAAYPMALSALDGLDRNLPRMGEFAARCAELCSRLQRIDNILLNPASPQGNACQILFRAEPADVTAAHLALAHARGVWLFNRIGPSALTDWTMAELVIGTASDHWRMDEGETWIRELNAKLRR
ncbi:threonine aldolase [Sandaracinobacter neustonicus]|uniref:Threonine aldolase n=1 Tax=Sandaracinobacter neustonicus TaxID=1715348 RepID=A0A501XWJ8_9SPHN|nr:beta-eliminating lyase-related protein [Sandaracinobacter neustonicus]TPE64950.1 threonine aldolase [Sandaracinobacter neustonicus]